MKSEQKNIADDVKHLESENTEYSNQISSLSKELSTLKVFTETNTKKIEVSETRNAKKFDELFTSRNKTNEVLAELNTTVRMLISNINNQFENLDAKIEELKRGEK